MSHLSLNQEMQAFILNYRLQIITDQWMEGTNKLQ